MPEKATKAKASDTPKKGSQIGIVESDKRDKTRTVVVSSMTRHPKYGKYIRQRTVLQVHDAKNTSHTGDIVEVVACRPMSKSKSWALHKVIESRAEKTAAMASAKAQAESVL